MLNSDKRVYLEDIIKKNDYFQRSVNISYDSDNLEVLQNFYCPISYEQVLIKMIENVKQTEQSSFTWTGPYGSGKSSLAIFLQALINHDEKISKIAKSKLSATNKKEITKFFDVKKSWKVVNIIGRNDSPENIFKDCLNLPKSADSEEILNKLKSENDKGIHVIVFIDELGKIFDTASKSENAEDVYFLQQVAEFANRSQGKFLLIGILHQSFMAYAQKNKNKNYNDWLKIQGRFVDCPINLSVDEQIYLIGNIINHNNEELIDKLKKKVGFNHKISTIIKNISDVKKTNSEKLSDVLSRIFPIQPLVAILLCNLSKKNFGQNQRSIFSFLMSAETNGFSHYLKNTDNDEFQLYSPMLFWDYLQSNLNSLIYNSEYAKQWILSQLVIDRYEAKGNDDIVSIIKTICVIGLFADDSGVHATDELLSSATNIPLRQLKKYLEELQESSIIFYKKYSQSYVLSEGSDFDLQKTIDSYLVNLDNLKFSSLEQFSPIIAKKHYQNTGALRWLSVKIIPFSSNLEKELLLLSNKANSSLIGYLVLILPKDKKEENNVSQFLKNYDYNIYKNLVLGLVESYEHIIDVFKESIALNEILKHEEKLLNDKIARQEVENRLLDSERELGVLLSIAIQETQWHGYFLTQPQRLSAFQLSTLSSKLADNLVYQGFVCNNELVNTNTPSPSAKGAIRELVRRMIENSEEKNLGIIKYPAERGIYESVLFKNQIHIQDDAGNYRFARPLREDLSYLWQTADDIIREANGEIVTAKQIYDVWGDLPIGLKQGLFEILYIAYLMSRYHELAFYIEEEYRPTLQYLLAEYLIKDPSSVGIREISHLQQAQDWIFLLKNTLENDPVLSLRLKEPMVETPLSIARGLIAVFLSMPSWVQRTNHFSAKTKQLRNYLKQANDPNKLLFDELPQFFNPNQSDEQKVESIINSLHEMDFLYQNLVEKVNSNLIGYLKVNDSEKGFLEINKRAKKIFGKSGDYLLDAFISRLSTYNGSWNDAESLIGLLAGNKPSKNWIDQDIIRAEQQLANSCYHFLETEINSEVLGDTNRLKVGIITKTPSQSDSKIIEAHITSQNKKLIDETTLKLLSVLEKEKLDRNDSIAVLSKLFEQFSENDV